MAGNEVGITGEGGVDIREKGSFAATWIAQEEDTDDWALSFIHVSLESRGDKLAVALDYCQWRGTFGAFIYLRATDMYR